VDAVKRAIYVVIAFLIGLTLGSFTGAYLASPTVVQIHVMQKRAIFTDG